ncbi:MAG: hypothetical protein Q7J16_11575 [Candidatus Cloacimonadales bacterium]|nr:hypothetical protein [Candidatus Cloacimonadales bacterium]
MARTRYKFIEKDQPHFITCTVVNWICVFGKQEVAQIILDSLNFLQKEKRLLLFAYIIMEHHVHLIAKAENLEKEIANFKSFTARSIIDYYKETGQVQILKQLTVFKEKYKTDRDYQFWQEGNHPEQIQNYDMMQQKVEYIHNNPVRVGYVDEPIHWRLSSARNYEGMQGLIDVETDW